MHRLAAILALLACAAGSGCGADEDPMLVAEPPPASEVSVEEVTAEATSVLDEDEALGPGCFASMEIPDEPPPADQALVEATIVGAESAPPGLAYDPPEPGWTAYGPGMPCIAGAGASAFYAGADHGASVHLVLAVDEATARRAVADAKTEMGLGDDVLVERPADAGVGDDRVTITGDGITGVVWRRERYVAVVLAQHATEPGDAVAGEAARRSVALLSAAQDARLDETLARQP